MTSIELSEMSDTVYPPSEDTFALIDAVVELSSIDEALEIGCGSGLASLEIARRARRLLATDIDFLSVAKTRQVLKEEGLGDAADVICCSVMDAVRHGKTFDLIASNPPYLPTEGEDDKDISYAGGADGIATAKKIAASAVSHSNSRTRILLVVSSLTRATPVIEVLEKSGFDVEIKEGRRLFFESILILRASRRKDNRRSH